MATIPRVQVCPKCGASSRVRAVAWRLIESSDELETVERPVPGTVRRDLEVRGGPILVEKEKEMLEFETDTYETTYACRSCGHSWSRNSTTTKKAVLEDR